MATVHWCNLFIITFIPRTKVRKLRDRYVELGDKRRMRNDLDHRREVVSNILE